MRDQLKGQTAVEAIADEVAKTAANTGTLSRDVFAAVERELERRGYKQEREDGYAVTITVEQPGLVQDAIRKVLRAEAPYSDEVTALANLDAALTAEAKGSPR